MRPHGALAALEASSKLTAGTVAASSLPSSTHPLLQWAPWRASTSHPLLQGNPWWLSSLSSLVTLASWLRQPTEGGDDVTSDVFYGLAAAYGAVGLVALVQLVRIQRRVPEYGWTTQKVFHLLNFLVNAMRCAVFAMRSEVEALQVKALSIVLLDLPGLLFLTTYLLLVLFWAEIYHQARGLPTESLRPYFRDVNLAMYIVQAALWGAMYLYPSQQRVLDIASKSFFAALSLAAAFGFLMYGGRLFLMLRRFPIESRGRRKKLHEVGLVTFICCTCFSIRASVIAYLAITSSSDLDLLQNPVLDAGYYTLAELLPSALVLFILRKLPPKRNASTQVVR